MNVTVRYYALLEEQRGRESEQLQTDATTLSDLYLELQLRHGFTLPQDGLQVARNDEFVQWQDELADGDLVVFIPPVAGG